MSGVDAAWFSCTVSTPSHVNEDRDGSETRFPMNFKSPKHVINVEMSVSSSVDHVWVGPNHFCSVIIRIRQFKPLLGEVSWRRENIGCLKFSPILSGAPVVLGVYG